MLCFWTNIPSNLAVEMQFVLCILESKVEREKYKKEKKPGSQSLFFHQLKSIKSDFLNDLICLVSYCQGQLSVLWSDLNSRRKIPQICAPLFQWNNSFGKALPRKGHIKRETPKVSFLRGTMVDSPVSVNIQNRGNNVSIFLCFILVCIGV